MNAMTQALQEAGVKTPSQMQRVWTALHDTKLTHGMSAKQVAAATGIASGNVSGVLTDMVSRGMVSVTKEPKVPTPLHGPRFILHYKAVGDVYELKPRKHMVPKANKKNSLSEMIRARAEAPKVELQPVEHKETGPRQVVTLRRPIRIDDWTIAEAREVYEKLKGMFA